MRAFISRGAISDPELFYNREDVVRLIFHNLASARPDNISIVGEHKVGKSSLLLYCSHPVNLQRFLTPPRQVLMVWCDLVLPMTPHVVFKTMQRHLCQALLKSDWVREASKHKARQYHETLSTPDLSCELGMAVQLLKEQLLELGERVKIIFLIDEADAVLSHIPVNVLDVLRMLSQSINYNVSYIVASREPLDAITQTQATSSPFYNVFVPHRLSGFTQEDSRQLVDGLAERGGVAFSEKDREFIWHAAGFHPYLIQLMCHYLANRRSEQGYDEVLLEAGGEAFPFFEDIWTSLSDLEQGLLVRLAKRQIMETLAHPRQMRRLAEKLLIRRQEDQWQLACVLLEVFLTVKEESLDPTGTLGGTRAALYMQIREVEQALRTLVRREYQKLYGRAWMEHVKAKHPEVFAYWEATYDRNGSSQLQDDQDLLDYSRLDNIRVLVTAQWQAFRGTFDFGQGRLNKHFFSVKMESLAKGRNALFHHRPIPENELLRLRVTCNDLLACLVDAHK